MNHPARLPDWDPDEAISMMSRSGHWATHRLGPLGVIGQSRWACTGSFLACRWFSLILDWRNHDSKLHSPHSNCRSHSLAARMQMIYARLMQIYQWFVFAACRTASQAKKVINAESTWPQHGLLCSTCPAWAWTWPIFWRPTSKERWLGRGGAVRAVLGRMPIICQYLSMTICAVGFICVFMDWFRIWHLTKSRLCFASRDVICNTWDKLPRTKVISESNWCFQFACELINRSKTQWQMANIIARHLPNWDGPECIQQWVNWALFQLGKPHKHALKLRSKPIMGSYSNEPSVPIIMHYLSVTYSPIETKNRAKLLSTSILASHWAGEQVAGFTCCSGSFALRNHRALYYISHHPSPRQKLSE